MAKWTPAMMASEIDEIKARRVEEEERIAWMELKIKKLDIRIKLEKAAAYSEIAKIKRYYNQ